MKPQDALARVIEHREIFHDEMISLMRQIMSGEVTPVMIAAIIVGLRVKKETIGEISAAAQVMRELSTKVQVSDRARLVDTCGTGGDGAQTFNISTAAMFVAAATGARVAKHGGRSGWSQSARVARSGNFFTIMRRDRIIFLTKGIRRNRISPLQNENHLAPAR